MKAFILRHLIGLLIKLLLQNGTIDKVMAFIDQADQDYTNSMSKRGYVYRAIKAMEPEGTSQTRVNLALEACVFLFKYL